ncbi:hypothetical protein JANET_45 [Bacillus phage Janet]|nr:hypothetical protein JANET_45 [Bacillus phage Janet]
MDKSKVFYAIIDWEHEHGESFVDRFGYLINAPNFMFWAHAKGYIDQYQFNEWEDMYPALEADDPNYYIYTDDIDVEFALVVDEDRTEEEYHRAMKMLAEFISESKIYTERFEKFLRGEDE